MKLQLAVILVTVLGCSGTDSNNSGVKSMPANPCATPGASYLCTYSVESGDCPALANQVVNVNPDGTIVVNSSTSCSSLTVSGCTSNMTHCTMSNRDAQGVTCNGTFNGTNTFSSDGVSSTATESMSIDCSDGSFCNGSYQASCVRQ